MKREFFLPVVVAGVTVAFATVSLLVWATRGRNAALIRRKLTLGALLINLTQVTVGCGDGFDGGRVTCYVPPPPPNSIELHLGSAGLELDPAVSTIIEGTIFHRQGTTFSFQVISREMAVVQAGNIAAADGAYDASTEAFTIEISTELAPGDYRLNFYAVPADEVDAETEALESFSLRIVGG